MMEQSGKSKVESSVPQDNTASKVKLDALEEMLENILLAFGGALAIRMLRQVRAIFQLKRWFISLLEGIRKGKEDHIE